ncbi:ferrous iron transport protein B [Marvinbryantia formatexigens DSM 14469]|uniref:Ferrous iron transport protein B n=1 Tax=Marvinbryantia formatexigens DSM 14469 TaxID=478749 RepID=C6LAG6_9FIRM|nr:ferrous iron transport protein B [Marvinbryantia formatexigens]EET62573.1 ferrous iron transport protein B [Marvinbryantia formatexigens DSM 14469]UWO23268.1 ferrous iron transport protein B [Marvinbryantia formatexigens DSM 14469]SDG61722.1 ferrous iron transport protein B [Marvinbryantia formatexigens]
MTLKELEIGKSAVVTAVGGEGALRQHFLDMGVIPGAEITLVKYAPMGDPMELRIHGYELTLRLADAEKIEIEKKKAAAKAPEGKSGARADSRKKVEHPGLGEGGRYHVKADEHPLPEGTKLTFALAGNQNCGKTTLFNQLTGSNQHVGNFPGVTVDRKSGSIKGYPQTEITDLPGIYSMSPYSSEELVTRQFIIGEKPTGIINIVDATNIERNLYLTMQLMELDVPMVLALNMMDEVRGNGGSVRINEMEELLGIPVVPISAAKNEGVDELVRHAIHVAQYQERPGRTDFCSQDEHGGAVHRCLHGIMHLIEDHAKAAGIPVRFAATKLVEGDERILSALALSQNEKEMIEHIICQMEEERGLDRAAAIADMRFDFIQKLVDETVVKPQESREHVRSRKIDRVLTGKYTAIPAFVGIMGLVFYLTFNVIGAWLQGLLELGIGYLTDAVDVCLTSWNINEAIHSLIIDGIFNGVGSVLSFLPIIVTLFFFLSLLEDTGYMARVAFVMDKLLRKIGLSGRSIVPMLIGFGCTVPGVMASRTLPSERDRKMTIMLTPFMSCSAKLPIYGFFASAFFPEHAALVMVGLYFIGILVGILVALISKNSMFKGEAVPFVMELPNYRLPGAKNVAQLLWEKAKDFLQRAFTVIFMATIIIWFLQTFDLHFQMVSDSQNSILAVVAGWIAPLFAPLGFGDWRISTALITGFMAKESVVSTLNVLFGSTEAVLAAISPLAAASLLVFCLLYTPCVAAIASIKRELGGKWAAGVVIGQCAIAWVCALLVRLIGMLFGLG